MNYTSVNQYKNRATAVRSITGMLQDRGYQVVIRGCNPGACFCGETHFSIAGNNKRINGLTTQKTLDMLNSGEL